MLKHVYLILVATFIFGFVSGAILFLYNYHGRGEDVKTFEDDATLSIIAYRYGDCSRTNGCASYRITDTGAYTYIMRSDVEGEKRFDDSLSTTEKAALFKTLRVTDFSNLEKSLFTGTCPVAHAGVAYRYTILYNAKQYQFDTCRQALDDVPFFTTLADYFQVFETAYATP